MQTEPITTASLERYINGLGSIRGVEEGRAIVFRGVPYAKPPLGAQRFAPPLPADPWGGTLDASRHGPICPQLPSRVFESMGEVAGEQNEDCLTLTIWVPQSITSPAPVMVWYHGGGYSSGAGSLYWYDGRRYAEEHGIIVVTMNYRLGALGYLAIPGVLPGNLALLDQALALRWVHHHIADLGGDPSNVTLAGQSGGGQSISLLLTMPETDGWFDRVILQSPPLGVDPIDEAEAEQRGATFLAQLGIPRDAPDILVQLRALPVEKILQAQMGVARALGRMEEGDLSPPFKPANASPVVAGSGGILSTVAANVAARSVDVMIGWTRDEARLFYAGNPMLDAMTTDMLAVIADKNGVSDLTSQPVLVERPGEAATPGEHFLNLVTNLVFRVPSIDLARDIVRRGGRAFVYQFDIESPARSLLSAHCMELPFVFGNCPEWTGTALLGGSDAAAMERKTQTVMNLWASFIRSGKPGFPAWDQTDEPILHLDDEGVVQR
jgi:para-nitrobenzyl esterase